MRNCLLILSVMFISNLALAQSDENITVPTENPLPGIRVSGIVVGTDTFAYVSLPTCLIESEMPFETKKKYAEWTRLKYNVKKVYPYAIIASARLKEYEKELEKIPTESLRKAYMKEAEKKLQAEFAAELKELTVNQGKILIKLIDRETGHTSYELVKELRGSFSAFMWQSLASLFGSSLKSQYDPAGEDKLIETAIRQIEAGQF